MDFEAFEHASREIFHEIPKRYRAGVDGLFVHRPALSHPRFQGIYTLGECVTESYPSAWGGPETIRSRVVLHWGSFLALAEADPGFDWREQIWETLTHELRHHLESLADQDDLIGVDYAMEQTFLRHDGQDFDIGYYRYGDRVGPATYAVEDEVYIEQSWKSGDFARGDSISFSWAGKTFQLDVPVALGDVHFVRIVEGVPSPPYVELVLVRKASWLERARKALTHRAPEVYESDAVAWEADPQDACNWRTPGDSRCTEPGDPVSTSSGDSQ